MIRKFPWKVPEKSENYIFRNANHSTENSWLKIKWNKNSRYIFFEDLGTSSRGCPFFWNLWNFPNSGHIKYKREMEPSAGTD